MTAKEIQVNNINDWLYALQQRNLVYNHNFTLFSNQGITDNEFSYNHPDGWMYDDEGTDGSITYNTISRTCQIVTSSTSGCAMAFSQALHEFPLWEECLQGSEVKAQVRLSVSEKCQITLQLDDGVDASAKQISDSDEMLLEVSHKVSKNATYLALSITCSSPSITINIDKVCANRGAIALDTLPCMVEGVIGERRQYMSIEVPPATELSLCAPTQELLSNYSRLSSFLNGKFGTGDNNRSMLPDMRGYFSRAWNNGAEIDPDATTRTALGDGTVSGDQVGTVEQDIFESHDHTLDFSFSGQLATGDVAVPNSLIPMSTPSTNSEVDGGKETRSINISELYTIKWA